MMKKLSIIALCIAISLYLISCKNNNSNPETTEQVNTVYVSKSGKKIHCVSDCSGMRYYWEMSYDDAVEAGYDFCKVCY